MTDVAQLLQKISKTFQGTTWKSYKYVDEGWDHVIIILDESVVFRFPLEPEYAEQLFDEIKILKQLDAVVTLPIPKYDRIAPDHSFAGYKLVPGNPLTTQKLASMSRRDRKMLLSQLAGFISDLHSVSSKQPAVNIVPSSDMPEYFADLQRQAPQYLRNTMTVSDFLLVEAILKEIDELLTGNYPKVLLHGDLYRNHLLWDEAKHQLGIIDFSDMNIGDPAFDFAELYEYGKDFVEEVYEIYTGAKDDGFLERAWKYQRLVGVYMLVDHFLTHKTSFAIARETFDRTKSQSFF